MFDATTVADSAHSDSLDSIPFVRGLAKLIPPERLQAILDRTGRTEQRKRRLTAQSFVWLIVAMSLYARDSIPMAWQRLHGSSPMPEPDPSAFTKSRKRLGVRPMRELFQEVAKPIATPETPGAFYRGLRLMAIDGTTLDMPDTKANETVFGRGGNQRAPNAFSAGPSFGPVRGRHARRLRPRRPTDFRRRTNDGSATTPLDRSRYVAAVGSRLLRLQILCMRV